MSSPEVLNPVGIIPFVLLVTVVLVIFAASVIQDWRSGK